MSNCKMSLVVLCVASATLAYPDSARAQYFEGSGVLGLSQPPEQCLVFFPDSGEYPLGLGTAIDWGGFHEVGDRIYATGVLLACGGVCIFEALCFDADSVFVAWPIIPTVSEWGMIALGLCVLVAGTIVICTGKRYDSTMIHTLRRQLRFAEAVDMATLERVPQPLRRIGDGDCTRESMKLRSRMMVVIAQGVTFVSPQKPVSWSY